MGDQTIHAAVGMLQKLLVCIAGGISCPHWHFWCDQRLPRAKVTFPNLWRALLLFWSILRKFRMKIGIRLRNWRFLNTSCNWEHIFIKLVQTGTFIITVYGLSYSLFMLNHHFWSSMRWTFSTLAWELQIFWYCVRITRAHVWKLSDLFVCNLICFWWSCHILSIS